MQRTNPILLVLYTLFNYLYCEVRKYEIHESNNNFPRPVLTHDNSALATSG